MQPHFLVILDIETTCDDVNDPRHPEIVEFPWLVYHVASRTVLDSKQIFVAPRWNANPNPPPDAVRGLGTDVAFAPSLADALLQFDTYVYHSFVVTAKPFVLVTDGHWDISHVLLTEAAQKALALAPHFRTYIDLRAEFSKCYPMAPVPADRKTMFSYLHISIEPRASGLEECLALANLVTRLLSDGHVLDQPVFISDYEWTALPAQIPAVATPVATAVAVGGIVRLRGLPWTCSERDVAHFLSGIPVVPNGIHFVRNAQGKATGEAFVQLESADAVSLALGRHKQTVGRRYIEVFKSSPVDMANHLGRAEARRHMQTSNKRKSSSGSFGRQRANRQGKEANGGGSGGGYQPNAASSSGYSYVVKVSGLAAHTRGDELLPLLHDIEVVGNGIHVVRTSDGECSGDAFVEVVSESWAKKLLARSGSVVHATAANGRVVSCRVEIAGSNAGEMKRCVGGKGAGAEWNGNGETVERGNGSKGMGANVSSSAPAAASAASTGTASGATAAGALGMSAVCTSNSGNASAKQAGTHEYYARVCGKGRGDLHIEDIRSLFERFDIGDEDVQWLSAEGGGGDGAGGNKLGGRTARVAFRSKELRDAAVQSGRGGGKERSAEVSAEEGGAGGAGGSRAWAAAAAAVAAAAETRRTVKMRGLPYSATEEDIVRFFKGYAIAAGGINRGRDRHGRASGEAWVTFVSAEEAAEAVARLDKAHMGSRYIELKL